MFVETARRVKHDFDTAGEQAAVVRICQLVEHLPLALELAASWTPLMTCAQIADHMQQDISILATDIHNVPERHRSIQAVFEHSWNLLSPAEQNALMRLSVFRGGWQAEQALPVAEANLLLLRRLVDKSLVRVGEAGRYDLHELVRQFAAARLAQSGHDAETRQRHVSAYRALSEQLDAKQFDAQGLATLTRFDQEQDNLRAALAWNLDQGQPDFVLGLLRHLWSYWLRRGYVVDGERWGSPAIRQMGDAESIDLCVALSFVAPFVFYQSRFGDASAYIVRALPMARRLEDPEALIPALFTYNFSSMTTEQAMMGLNEGIALIQATGKWRSLLPIFYLSAATWFMTSGRYAEASDYCRQSIAWSKQLNAPDMGYFPLGVLGHIALEESQVQEAYDLTLESMAIGRRLGKNLAFAPAGNVLLGMIHLYMEDAEAAESSLQAGLLASVDSVRDLRGMQEALAVMSEIALARGDLQAAQDRLKACLEICRTLYDQLQATRKLEGTHDALPIDLISLCARASLVAGAQGHDERAVTLYGAAEELRLQSEQSMIPPLKTRLEDSMAVMRSTLAENAFASAWEAGQQMSLSEAFAFLLH